MSEGGFSFKKMSSWFLVMSTNMSSENDYWEEIRQPIWTQVELSHGVKCWVLTSDVSVWMFCHFALCSVFALAWLWSDILKDRKNSSTHSHTRIHSTAPCGSISTGGRGGEFPFKVPYALRLEPPTVTSQREDGLQIKRNNNSLEAEI